MKYFEIEKNKKRTYLIEVTYVIKCYVLVEVNEKKKLMLIFQPPHKSQLLKHLHAHFYICA